MLLDPFEEQFNLPSVVIDRRHCGRRDLEIVRQENETLIGVLGVKTHAAKQVWEFPRTVFVGEHNGLITSNAGGAIHGMRATSTKAKTPSGADNKIGQVPMEMVQAKKIDVATIHDNEASRFRDDAIQYVGISCVSACDVDQYWDSALQVQERIQFYRSSGAFVRSPGKQRQTQIDD
jgi:hypothetical protein